MKTHRILAVLTTAVLLAASMPCFSKVKFISGDEDNGKVVITSKVLSPAEVKEMGMIFVAGKLEDDEISITLELKKEGMLKNFSSFKLSIRDGGKAVFEGPLNSKFVSKPDCPVAAFTIQKSLLSKARLSIHAGDERDPKGGPYDDLHAGLYVLNLHEHVPAELLIKAGEPAIPASAAETNAPPFKPGIRDVEPPVGSLGYKIGSYLTIEGVREEEGKVGISTLRVDTINGHKLEQPVPIWMYGVELPEKERCIFKGYETGQWIGVPEEVLRATGKPAPQAGWQFHFGFSPTSVEQPKSLKLNDGR